MKNLIQHSFLVLMSLFLFNCSSDDGGGISNPDPDPTGIIGVWELDSGTGDLAEFQYFVVRDNKIIFMSEQTYGFRSQFSLNAVLSDGQINVGGIVGVLNYEISGNQLSVSSTSIGNGEFTKHTGSVNEDNFMQTLEILTETDAPWEYTVDIAFADNYIWGYNDNFNEIQKVNPITLVVDDSFATSNNAKAVEIENYTGSSPYHFESSGGSATFKSYDKGTSSLNWTSIDTGAWIHGLASGEVDSELIWVASNNTRTLYLYNYGASPDEILESYVLDNSPQGLHYENGYLYVCYGGGLHKCDVSSGLEVVETYKIDGHEIDGVTYDGVNFWLNSWSDGNSKLVKVDLTS